MPGSVGARPNPVNGSRTPLSRRANAEQGFDTFSTPHPSLGPAQRRAIEFVEAFPALDRGLFFIGPCGVGKTHLSVAVLKAIVAEHDVSARFVDEAELLRSLQYSYGRDSRATEEELLRPLRRADLLIWDDLGTGRPTDWVRETIHTIVNHRYTNQRLTVFSSNWRLSAKTRRRDRGSRADAVGSHRGATLLSPYSRCARSSR